MDLENKIVLFAVNAPIRKKLVFISLCQHQTLGGTTQG